MPQREVLEVDALFVGAGPAGLGGAIYLSRLLKKSGRTVSIAVIEKAKEVGAHSLSGAVVDPKALIELLIPDEELRLKSQKDGSYLKIFSEMGVPIEGVVDEDYIYFLTESDAVTLPFTLKPLHNKGYLIISLAKLTRWLARTAEKEGIDVFTGFPAVGILANNGRIGGVRTGDKGVDKHSNPKSNYEPGVDITAKVTVICEGTRGHLYRQLNDIYLLDQYKNKQVYATGVKEIWEFPRGSIPPNRVIHTMGWPLKSDAFGGGFIYSMGDNKLCIGFVIGLDYHDPFLDAHYEFQRFKAHPKIASILDGGKMIEYGAKTIPEGGWYSLPRLFMPGCLIAGDTGGLLDAMRLKGVHLAMKSGMLAAETIAEALEKDDYSDAQMSKYERAVFNSYIGKELYKSRGFKQGFAKHGFWIGLLNAGFAQIRGGAGFVRRHMIPGHLMMKTVRGYYGNGAVKPERMKFDNKLTFSKLEDVYYAGTIHDEDSPCHLIVKEPDICVNRCTQEYGNPCQYFCPASVYEFLLPEGDAKGRLQINFSNCVHCKTCDIMDPYGIIRWVPPEGGGGPAYKEL
ncbi:MAG: hypothetical protein A2W23_08580 [Planctomycetes bacterium RBG_16_43_13]|nr:MAG: hypothetical protein A2W23_08580 [Planctomycetes bacterium RBG_16_43_13]